MAQKKTGEELGRKIWIIQTKEGKKIDKFSSKVLAKKYKEKYEKDFLQKLDLVRDNSYRNKLKKNLKEKNEK